MRKDQLTENGLEIYVLNTLMFYIGNSLNEIEFKQFISKAIKEWEKYIVNKNSMEMQVDARIAGALKSSSMLSSIYHNW